MLTTERSVSCNECNTVFKPEIDPTNNNFPKTVYCPNCEKEVNFRDSLKPNPEEMPPLGFIIAMIPLIIFAVYIILMIMIDLIQNNIL